MDYFKQKAKEYSSLMQPEQKPDREVQMAKIDMMNMKKNLDELCNIMERLPEDHNLPAWVQAKIVKADSNIQSATSYLRYSFKRK
jgi:hypothetical protein